MSWSFDFKVNDIFIHTMNTNSTFGKTWTIFFKKHKMDRREQSKLGGI